MNVFSVELSIWKLIIDNDISGVDALGDTPVPIPNTTVKTQEADGTALETVWEGAGGCQIYTGM